MRKILLCVFSLCIVFLNIGCESEMEQISEQITKRVSEIEQLPEQSIESEPEMMQILEHNAGCKSEMGYGAQDDHQPFPQGGVGSGVQIEQTLEERAQNDSRHFPDIVSILPDGFIPLDKAAEESEDVLRALFWSTNFVAYDSEGITIFQTDVKNNDFIVIYKNAYYVNESIFNEIVESATAIYEHRNTVHNIGDAIIMRGRGGAGTSRIHPAGRRTTAFNIKIIDVERDIVNGFAVYHFNFSIDPNVNERLILDFFSHIETRNGTVCNCFTLVNNETLQIKVDGDDFIDLLVLNIPDELRISVIQNSRRMIRIGD